MQPWLPSKILPVTPGELKPDPRNARLHSPSQVNALAASITRFGFPVPILIDAQMNVIAGHGRLLAAQQLKLDRVPVIVIENMTADERHAYMLADNQLALLSEWDDAKLSEELRALTTANVDLTGIGLDDLLAELRPPAKPAGDLDAVPAETTAPVDSRVGRIYHLGPHRLMCGDSIHDNDVKRLMEDAPIAALIHADPPYGMGKKADGVENDNLYASKLNEFQMKWWRTWRPYLANNGSTYVWGNPEELWRLWHVDLAKSERMTLRNEIVWDKEAARGINSEEMRQYPPSTERCLFFMLGEQGFNNNSDNYWPGWEPLRAYLADELAKAGWTTRDVERITGTQMAKHWFTTSQWCLITAEHYAKLQTAAAGTAFTRDHAALTRDHAALTRDHAALKAEFYGTRAYFDNTHQNMTDVWRFPRVSGADRHDHATPKPVDMIARAIVSSCPKGGLVLEPFAGTGTTLIAAAATGRICRTMEITPKYCDTIRRRWTTYATANGLEVGSGALV